MSPHNSHILHDMHDSHGSPLRRCESSATVDSVSPYPLHGGKALPTLAIHQLTFRGRTWTAIPPLRLKVQGGWQSFYVADPGICLYARSGTIESLEDVVAEELAFLWDTVVIEEWERLPAEQLQLLQALVERFQLDAPRRRWPVARTEEPWCREGCLGGNLCRHSEEHPG